MVAYPVSNSKGEKFSEDNQRQNVLDMMRLYNLERRLKKILLVVLAATRFRMGVARGISMRKKTSGTRMSLLLVRNKSFESQNSSNTDSLSSLAKGSNGSMWTTSPSPLPSSSARSQEWEALDLKGVPKKRFGSRLSYQAKPDTTSVVSVDELSASNPESLKTKETQKPLSNLELASSSSKCSSIGDSNPAGLSISVGMKVVGSDKGSKTPKASPSPRTSHVSMPRVPSRTSIVITPVSRKGSLNKQPLAKSMSKSPSKSKINVDKLGPLDKALKTSVNTRQRSSTTNDPASPKTLSASGNFGARKNSAH
jgi:hypothetical protein